MYSLCEYHLVYLSMHPVYFHVQLVQGSSFGCKECCKKCRACRVWIKKCLLSRLEKHVSCIIDKGENMLVCSGLISKILPALLRECYVKILFKSIDVTCSLHVSTTYSYYATIMSTFVYFHTAICICSALLWFSI